MLAMLVLLEKYGVPMIVDNVLVGVAFRTI